MAPNLPKKLELTFYFWFAIIPIFCIVFDTIFSIIEPNEGTFSTRTQDFDIAVMSQTIYLSVWVGMFTSIYGILNIIAFFKPNAMPQWVRGKNFFTSIMALVLIEFIVYNVDLIYTKVTDKPFIGFNTWYNIIKSILEHMLTPIISFIYFYVFAKSLIKTKEYMKKYSFYVYIMLIPYLTYAIIRAFFELEYYPGVRSNSNGKNPGFNPFPYPEMDWTNVGPALFVVGLISLIVVAWAIGVFLNWTSNLAYKSINSYEFDNLNKDVTNNVKNK
ncbi:hypothetical protein SHELI_v1c03740 [Spiroplasma helicoides]|uniref:Transmembrane protein n=1 Tax=Spiroplasma helicoides TaxID=216938 RepID=A0A1B3SK76_9MOLU|nr:hypothetical protein [Spiroplasma helicoides]AOG60327.1 hypothetical protein SHELI_v1c03740 [Spiroplasma helicoides]